MEDWKQQHKAPMLTHEEFINHVRSIAASRIPEAADREKLLAVKLTYGAGTRGVRGITFYNQWSKHEQAIDFAMICATNQESVIQLAGTTIHELGHVLTGSGHGHDKEWKRACYQLGLRQAQASTARYSWAMLAPDIREAVYKLGIPTDGEPKFLSGAKYLGGILVHQGPNGQAVKLPSCTHGHGSRGGKSRGPGSGSRMFKCVCPQCGYTARVARAWLDKGAPLCPTDKGPLT